MKLKWQQPQPLTKQKYIFFLYTPVKIESGELGVAIIHNIHSGWIKTECKIYVDDDITGTVCTCTNQNFGVKRWGEEI